MKVEDLKKLPAKERLERLKKAEENRKKEIESMQDLMRDSMREIVEDQIDLPIEQLKADVIDTLITFEEKELYKTKRFTASEQENEQVRPQSQNLEEVAVEEMRLVKEMPKDTGYGSIVEQEKRRQEMPSDYMQKSSEKVYENLPGHDASGKPQDKYARDTAHITQTSDEKMKDTYEKKKIKSKEISGRYA